jgi:ATP-binding cassette subfamily F protein 3
MRAALARLLLLRPDLLLLDEPTNHLDLESLGWLESFLTSYAGSVVVVSHDRYFLNRMVTSIAEMAQGAVTLYVGDYDHYLVEREARHALLEARQRNQAKRVAEISGSSIAFAIRRLGWRGGAEPGQDAAKVERIEVGEASRRIHFSQPPRSGRLVVAAPIFTRPQRNTVYAGWSSQVTRQRGGPGRGERGQVLPPQDAGGRSPRPRSGRSAPRPGALLPQHQLDALDPSRTVLKELEQADPQSAIGRLRSILGSFLFSGDQVDKRIAVLSGGEKARVALAKMLVRPAALLCMDEPTNHLDLASKEVLEEALATFNGTIVFISHDRYFINRIATHVVEVGGGRLTTHLGNYDEYLERKVGSRWPRAACPEGAPSRRSPRHRDQRPRPLARAAGIGPSQPQDQTQISSRSAGWKVGALAIQISTATGIARESPARTRSRIRG